MAELGLLGLPFPSEFGGFGGGAVDMMSTMEVIGGALIVEPYLATIGLGAQFLARAGTPAQKNADSARRNRRSIDDGVCACRSQGALRPRACRHAREPSTGNGYRIDGTKRVVVNGRRRRYAGRVGASIRRGDADSNGIGAVPCRCRARSASA
mgnify:CR=1 FL=1